MKEGTNRAYFTERFPVALSPRDKAALERLSSTMGETKAVIVRRLIRQEAQRRGLWPATNQPQPQGVSDGN